MRTVKKPPQNRRDITKALLISHVKKQTKGIIFTVIFGGSLLFWATAASMPSLMQDEDAEFTSTGTPADNFPDSQRAQFCGEGTAKSNTYVEEFAIPTECTQPLAITSDFNGNIWFMQTNTGNIARFDPVSRNFAEYENPAWPEGGRSMVWGMDYSADNSIWYSDEAHDSVWRFSIDGERYQRFDFPSEGNSLPQRLLVDGSQIIINDFTGNKLTMIDASGYAEDIPYVSIPSPVEQSVTAGFARDSNSDIWYTNWLPDRDGVLAKLSYEEYAADLPNAPADGLVPSEYIDVFRLPPTANAINGIAVDGSDRVWLADTATSHFYSFDPSTESFTQYTTAPVAEGVFGNHTGLIKSTPLSRPYWMGLGGQGEIIFNEQTANRIAVFEPFTERLTEYAIPSMNPAWSDCGEVQECGIAQSFDFTIVGDKIWFTEWAANNIGVLDTSLTPAIDVLVSQREVYQNSGQPASVSLEITANSGADIRIVSGSAADGLISLTPAVPEITLPEGSAYRVSFEIAASEELPAGQYKVLVGGQTPEITASQFFTLIVS